MNDTPDFRTVRRGYDPVQVDEYLTRAQGIHAQAVDEASAKTVEVSKLASALEEARARITELEAQPAADTSPVDYSGLGPRISQMLQLAEEEAAEMRAAAQAEADVILSQARTQHEQQLAAGETYEAECRARADSEAARILETARREADDLLDHADREASARRREAEAIYEQQRAAAASAAADFESTLAARRDAAAEEFATQMSAQQKSLAAAQDELADAEANALRVRDEAQTEADAVLERAQREARQLVDNARGHAERVRRDSERELAAIASRRDAITDQLSNVRQMLATLGGGSALAALLPDSDGETEIAPAPAEETDSTVEVEQTEEAEQTEDGDADATDETPPAEGAPHSVIE